MFRLVRVLCLSLSFRLALSAAPTFEGNEKVNCGGVYKNKRGAIESPGWPQNYPARLHCVYEIGVLPGRKITLQFAAFHLRPRVGRRCLDRLRLYDGDNFIGGRVFCGREISPTRAFTSKTSKVTVIFTTHRRRGIRGFPGFRATYSSAYYECGVPVFHRRPWSRRTGNKIVGGETVNKGSFPWQVSLQVGSKHFCGGTLVSQNLVITAAHCIIDVGSRSIRAVVGEHDINKPESKAIAKVRNIIVYPQYNAKTLENDIALLKLDFPVPLNDYIQPICLPEPGMQTPAGTVVTTTGWGALTFGGDITSILHQVDAQVVGDEECREMISGYINFPIFETSMCTRPQDTVVDACQGDSGGPVVVFPSDGPAYLVGIASWSIGCGKPDIAGVNTEVSYFVPWIYDIMDKNT
ncbi:trypsin-1-like [Branchiostoma lanceolatum]|uniref:trypsin-1-like n=1 Tax=Branchiostoma lanceolatum TaxID=7740 RepID=UPI0034557FD7